MNGQVGEQISFLIVGLPQSDEPLSNSIILRVVSLTEWVCM